MQGTLVVNNLTLLNNLNQDYLTASLITKVKRLPQKPMDNKAYDFFMVFTFCMIYLHQLTCKVVRDMPRIDLVSKNLLANCRKGNN